MSTADLVLSYLHVLIWPALICVLAVTFRSTIRRLLQVRLAQLDAGGISVKFNAAVMDAEEVVGVNQTSRQTAQRGPAKDNYITMSPLNYTDLRQAGEAFRDGKGVILDLTNTKDNEAKRMIDFSAGLIFMGRGAIDRIDFRKFALTPNSFL
jgi:hypothetical protein